MELRNWKQLTPTEKITKARIQLLINPRFAFHGRILATLPCVEDSTCKTGYTDGMKIGYNPAFIDAQTMDQTMGFLAHEALHVALMHPSRRNTRNPIGWNIATDYAINTGLTGDQFTLPDGGLVDDRFTGMSADEIWNILKAENPPPPQPQQGDGTGQPGDGEQQPGDGEQQPGQGNPFPKETPQSWDEVRDLPGDVDKRQHERKQKALNQSAMQAARRAGTLPAGLKRELEKILAPSPPWPEILRRHLTAYTANDYTYSRPNRRTASLPMIMPALRTECAGHIALAIDTSGSIDSKLLSEFTAQFNHIISDVNPERVTVIYCDTTVSGAHTHGRFEPLTINPIGGGGTRFQPVFDLLANTQPRPDVLLYFTDMASSDVSEIDNRPGIPVLWLAYDAYQSHIDSVNTGEVIKIR